MPKFKITHYKDILYKAESIIEAKDIEEADSIAYNITLDKFNGLDWKDAEYEEPLWEATQSEEITDG